MLYIVGLGNTGAEYEQTRHNAGFLALEYLSGKFSLPPAVKAGQYAGRISEGEINGLPVTLFYPLTQMNHSGKAVKKLLTNNSGTASELLLIYDDIDIVVGNLKLSFGRGDGGHKGLKSVIDVLGTKDFNRIRVGIAGRNLPRRPQGGEALSRYVLSPFTTNEIASLETVFETISEAVSTLLTSGWEIAMNRFN